MYGGFFSFGFGNSMDCVLKPNDQNIGGIWIGDISSASDKDQLEKNNIKAILTVADGTNLHYPAEYEHAVIKADDYINFDLSKHFETSNQFIDNALQKTNVLVHCFAGISRSSTCVIAYLMKKNGQDAESAYKLVKSKRREISPNRGFVRCLHLYEGYLRE